MKNIFLKLQATGKGIQKPAPNAHIILVKGNFLLHAHMMRLTDSLSPVSLAYLIIYIIQHFLILFNFFVGYFLDLKTRFRCHFEHHPRVD